MTTVQGGKIARRKLGLLQLSQEVGNVSKASKIIDPSREQLYEIQSNFQIYGAHGLVDRLPDELFLQIEGIEHRITQLAGGVPFMLVAICRRANIIESAKALRGFAARILCASARASTSPGLSQAQVFRPKGQGGIPRRSPLPSSDRSHTAQVRL